MNNHDNAPIFGSVVSSRDYDRKIERRQWLKKYKGRIMVLSGALVCAAAAFVAFINVI